jgi:toxin FitB
MPAKRRLIEAVSAVIILDTNVISACMRPLKNRAVIDWLNSHAAENIWTTTITLFELRYGIEKLAGEQQKAELEKAWQTLGGAVFGDRILSFDVRASRASSRLAAERKKKNRAVEIRDTFIAGIALSRSAVLATRNIRDFADAGIVLVDPWAPTPS